METLFETGVRPIIDNHLVELAKQQRDYGDYWSASSAGYCMRRNIFERLKIPHVKDDPRKQRIFTSGDIFHAWIQGLTKSAGVSLAQELELQDDKLMIRGHIDDLIKLDGEIVLYDYKSTSSRSFSHIGELSHYHKMQVGTYLYMLRRGAWTNRPDLHEAKAITEARILKISKDDLRLAEQQVLWTPKLSKEVSDYWTTLNGYWKALIMPKCTCDMYENGFLARPAYNPFYYNGKPCSMTWYNKIIKERK